MRQARCLPWQVVAALLLAGPAMAADLPGLVHMSAEQQKTVGLHMAPAERRPISEPVRVTGNVTYEPSHLAILRPFGEARLTRIMVTPGDVAAAGQVVAELEMPSLLTAEQDLLAAQASLKEADAAVAVARAALARANTLVKGGSFAQAEADRRRLVLAQAEATKESNAARATALRTAVARLGPLGTPGMAGLRSPLSGIVVTVDATAGEVVESGRSLITVADLSTVLVLANLPERSAGDVSVDDPARISLPEAGRVWTGRVATLATALDLQARTLPVRIPVANPDGALRVGMFADVTITSLRGRDAVTVPTSAVQLVGDKHVVFTPAGGDGFQSHDVQLGVQQSEWDEILGGVIKPGAPVVTDGSFDLKALLQKSMLGGG